MRQIAAEVIREKSLYALDAEVPHGIAVAIDVMKERETGGSVGYRSDYYLRKESHKGIIIGKQGAMPVRIGKDARYELEHMLEAKQI